MKLPVLFRSTVRSSRQVVSGLGRRAKSRCQCLLALTLGVLAPVAVEGITPTATLTGLNAPAALAFDSSGNLFVANSGTTTIKKFAPGATAAFGTLNNANGPIALAFDSSGTLFAAKNGTIVGMAPR